MSARRFRFGIKPLLVGVSLFAAIVALIVKPVIDTHKALALIERQGGQVYYLSCETPHLASRFAEYIMLPDVEIRIRTSEISPPTADALSTVRSIDLLHINNDAKVRLDFLSRLKDVKELAIKMGDDEVFDRIGHLTDLRSLRISGEPIIGSAMHCIVRLENLRTLDLSYTSITDDALQYVAELPKLESLYLTGTPISDAGIAHLIRLKNLKVLLISETNVSPACLQDIKKLASLQDLEIACRSFIYDNTADFEVLRHLGLRRFTTHCLIVGDDGEPEIKAFLPECRIEAFFYYHRNDYNGHVDANLLDYDDPFESVAD